MAMNMNMTMFIDVLLQHMSLPCHIPQICSGEKGTGKNNPTQKVQSIRVKYPLLGKTICSCTVSPNSNTTWHVPTDIIINNIENEHSGESSETSDETFSQLCHIFHAIFRSAPFCGKSQTSVYLICDGENHILACSLPTVSSQKVEGAVLLAKQVYVITPEVLRRVYEFTQQTFKPWNNLLQRVFIMTRAKIRSFPDMFTSPEYLWHPHWGCAALKTGHSCITRMILTMLKYIWCFEGGLNRVGKCYKQLSKKIHFDDNQLYVQWVVPLTRILQIRAVFRNTVRSHNGSTTKLNQKNSNYYCCISCPVEESYMMERDFQLIFICMVVIFHINWFSQTPCAKISTHIPTHLSALLRELKRTNM